MSLLVAITVTKSRSLPLCWRITPLCCQCTPRCHMRVSAPYLIELLVHCMHMSESNAVSTVDGALYLCALLKDRGVKFDYLFFTVGSWPDYSAPLSSEGIDKVVALDLLSHHVVLTRLYQHGLLANNARVMNTIASTQNFPFQSTAAVLARLEQPPGMLPFTLFPVAVAASCLPPACVAACGTDT